MKTNGHSPQAQFCNMKVEILCLNYFIHLHFAYEVKQTKENLVCHSEMFNNKVIGPQFMIFYLSTNFISHLVALK